MVAIQKISWKVEACLSYTLPDLEHNIHKQIFDDVRVESVSGMMIAPPPEEHKLQNSPAHVSRLSTKNLTTPSPLRFVQSYPEQVHTSTISSPPPSDDEYFRPKAMRRTTVSISKHQVQSLGLNMVDVVSLDSTSPQSRSNTIGISTAARLVQDDGVMGLEAVREKVLRKLAKEFPQLKSESENVAMRDKSSSTLALPHYYNDRHSTSTPLTLSPAHSISSMPKDTSPSSSELNTSPSAPGTLRERTKSLEFDKVSEAMSPTTHTASSISPFHQSTSETQLRANYTLPYKRRGTIMKIIRKGRKVRSFGRADTKIKTRVPISQPRTKSGSEFFSLDDEIRPESIELYSRGAFPSESPSRGLASLITCIHELRLHLH